MLSKFKESDNNIRVCKFAEIEPEFKVIRSISFNHRMALLH